MKFNPLQYPIMFSMPTRVATSSWIQHVPFAMLLIELLQPRLLVELGTHHGVSYGAFCQAVKELRTETLCYAVDTWHGDEHTGAYGEEVYEDFKNFHDLRYGEFSRLLRTTFDEALEYFADGSVDLLHIDGCHTYESVKHDFESWLPKLSTRAVVLLHDITERERGFGVWRLWDKLKKQYSSFEFLHEHGLGVLIVGSEITTPLRDLLEMSEGERSRIRELLFILGSRITASMQHTEYADRYQHVQNLQALVALRDEELGNAREYIDSLVEALERNSQSNALSQYSSSEIPELSTSVEEKVLTLQSALQHAQEESTQLRDRVTTLMNELAEAHKALQVTTSFVPSLESDLEAKNEEVLILQSALQHAQEESTQLRDRVTALMNELAEAHKTLQVTTSSVSSLEDDLEAKSIELVSVLSKAQDEQVQMSNNDMLLNQALAEAEASRQDAVVYAESLERARSEKEQELRELQTMYETEHNELVHLRNSFVYRRIGRPIWQFRQRVFPNGSRRVSLYYRLRRQSPTQENALAVSESSWAGVVNPIRQVVLPELQIESGGTVICTIISKNYLSSARTLMRSVHRIHPDIQLVTLLVDEIDGCFDPLGEVFSVYLAKDLGIPNWQHFSMKYDIMELNTAVKPYLLYMLMEKYGAQKIIYFDPDIVVYHDLNYILDLLNAHMAVLTPHILEPIRDTRKPAETDFLQVGTFNLGFFAISRQGQWRDLLRWWQERLYNQCTREIDQGLFVDQHWMDLVPSLFDSVFVLRDPGYNVAYWNIQERDLRRDETGNYTVNKRPLVFFHFSGFSVDNPNIVSRHQNRFVLEQLSPHYQSCFQDYRECLLENGYSETRRWNYAYGRFSDGVPIPDLLRICLRQHDLSGAVWENPFDTSASSFRSWATDPRSLKLVSYVSPYALTYHRLRTDLQKAFPDPTAADERLYANWFVAQEASAEVFHTFYVDPIRAALNQQLGPVHVQSAMQKKTLLAQRLQATIEYYLAYPKKVKPFLSPEAFTHPSVVYTGPVNLYRDLRWMLQRFGLLKWTHRLLGLRVILSLRFFFSQNIVPTPSSQSQISTHLGLRAPTAPVGNELRVSPITLSKPKLTEGANIVGYLRAETGVAEAARRTLTSLNAVQFPVHVYSIDVHDTSRQQDATIDNFQHGLQHYVNIFHVNADMTLPTQAVLGIEAYQDRYNIGYWFWEMPNFPARWRACADVYDEIWVGTRFVQQSLREVRDTPIVHMPGSIEVNLPQGVTRTHLGLPEDQFLVLFVFDALSVIERKNPWAVVSAFENAFSQAERERNVQLVVKVANLERFPLQQAKLLDAMKRVQGILLDGYMSRLEVNALISLCDVYMSLHRSEGFGLTLAEAMYLGKPCIATAYSGNTDFMSNLNSYLVPYQLTELTVDYPPYDAGNHWADPDIDAAAHSLRDVYTLREQALEKGQRAAHDIRANYSLQAAGRRMADHLRMIVGAAKGNR